MRQTERNKLVEQCAQVADRRAQVSSDAAEHYTVEQPDMAATERYAMLEARRIAAYIRLLAKS